MAWKDPEKQREAIRKHYYANREMYIDKAIRQKQALKAWVIALKEIVPCFDCGQNYPHYVMDFDHVDEKSMNISQMINRGSSKQIEAEIQKCDIVCSNCHRERTYNRLQD